MRCLPGHDPTSDLTYGDVFLVPSRSDVGSRFDVDLTPVDGAGTTIPIVVANMTAISGRRMAETVARRGAMAVLPQDVPVDQVQRTIGEVKAAHPILETPVTVDREDTVHTVLTLIEKRSHGAAVVIDGGRPVGVVTRSDCQGVDQFTQAGQVTTPDPTVLTLDVLTGPDALEKAYEAQGRPVAGSRPWWTTPASWWGCSPRSARCAPPSTPRRWTRAAGCGWPPPWG